MTTHAVFFGPDANAVLANLDVYTDAVRRGPPAGWTTTSQLKPCGTAAAYSRHLNKSETPCEPCCTAYKAHRRLDYRLRRAKALR